MKVSVCPRCGWYWDNIYCGHCEYEPEEVLRPSKRYTKKQFKKVEESEESNDH